MKLKTSLFNAAVLKKDITRFMPLWAVYSIGLVMFQMLNLSTDSEIAYRAANMAQYQIHSMAVVTFLYAGICAVTLFGDLYVPRMCNALHAMPMRREGWFLTHTAAGLLFGLIPNLLAALVTLPMLKSYGYIALIWLGGVMLQYVFFFGLALLCVMCAGSRLGMVTMYAIANFFSMFIYALVNTCFIPQLYGVVLDANPFQFLCPVYQITANTLIETDYGDPTTGVIIKSFVPSSWNYLFALAAIGVILAVIAALLYRRRQLERAGDFMAVPALSPVFLLIVTLGCGMLFYLFATLFSVSNPYPFLFLGMAVGYFVGRMLLERSVRVFQAKSILGYVLVAVLMGISLGVTRLDPMGLVTRIPAEDKIVSCSLSEDIWGPPERVVTDPMEIHQIMELHEALCQERPNHPETEMIDANYITFRIKVIYELTDGSKMERVYLADTRNETGRRVEAYLSSWQNLLGTDDLESLPSRIIDPTFLLWDAGYNAQEFSIPKEDLPRLLDAIKADSEAGNLSKARLQNGTQQVVASVEFYVDDIQNENERTTRWIQIDINEDCIESIAVLNDIEANNLPNSIS